MDAVGDLLTSLACPAAASLRNSNTGRGRCYGFWQQGWYGGFALLHADSPLVWFSESFVVQDLQALGLQMQPQAQRDITSYEILAQHALLM